MYVHIYTCIRTAIKKPKMRDKVIIFSMIYPVPNSQGWNQTTGMNWVSTLCKPHEGLWCGKSHEVWTAQPSFLMLRLLS